MESTTTTSQRNTYSISHYWGMVKDMDDSQKLQLITLLAESIKPAVAKTEETEDEEYSLHPFTKEELNARIDEAEAEIAAGIGTSHEEMMREWEEEPRRDLPQHHQQRPE